jgi:hypothetical protein
MQVTVVHEVSKCRHCPHATNNVREHDCPFTSTPAHVYWFCRHPKRPDYGINIDGDKAPPKNCPERATQAAKQGE